MKIKAHETGIYLWIDPEGMVALGQAGIAAITKASTKTVMEPGENPNMPPTKTEIRLWETRQGGLIFPKGALPALPSEWEWDIVPGEDGENIRLSLRPLARFPVKLEPAQMEILEAVREAGHGGMIEAAMGAGKSWLLLAIALGHPLLRPCAISGKGEKDTRQLLEKLKELNKAFPEYAETVMLSGLGRSLSKRDLKTLAEGEGIVVCTHAGLRNLPANTKLLLLDEAHAAATAKRIKGVQALKNLKKLYTLTGTAGLRGDGGDETLATLSGGTLAVKGHEAFESTGRVAPAQINAYNFWGRGIYAENPYIPDETPQEGYSLHATWVENHRGRHQFTADLVTWLPHDEIKVIFVPHILHAVRLCKAIEKKINELYGDLSPEQRANMRPEIFHAKADKNDKFYMPKEVREAKVAALARGEIKMAVATDFLSTGFDTNMIDHVVDASGQKAIITNIQRSGRGSRPKTRADGTKKITQIHTILDKTHPVMHVLGEKKFSALCAYYGHFEGMENPEREGGCTRFLEPPWIAPEDREKVRCEAPADVFKAKEAPVFDPTAYRTKPA
jgi:superfamily II DNA or RNA helicase